MLETLAQFAYWLKYQSKELPKIKVTRRSRHDRELAGALMLGYD
jgi:hypothetical protein